MCYLLWTNLNSKEANSKIARRRLRLRLRWTNSQIPIWPLSQRSQGSNASTEETFAVDEEAAEQKIEERKAEVAKRAAQAAAAKTPAEALKAPTTVSYWTTKETMQTQ